MSDKTERTLAWMSLLAFPGMGSAKVGREVERFGDVLEAWKCLMRDFPQGTRAARELAVKQLQRTGELGGEVLTFEDERYPEWLSHIHDPPPVLYARGIWPGPAKWNRALAVVGTRSCTTQGASWARQAGLEWTEAGGILVSGLARGIDGCAHRGALDGVRGGSQVAVLPCSLEAIHPRMHEPLAQEILDAGGLLVTEQPPGVQVERWMFASRNRILTGLSPRTLVVQSPARGGSLISARCALDQDREVYALWREGMGPAWAGNRALVADAEAMHVVEINDLWQQIAKQAGSQQPRDTRAIRPGNRQETAAVPPGCEDVWRALNANRATSWLELKRRVKGTESDLNRELFTLEVLGWIRRLPGRAYLRG